MLERASTRERKDVTKVSQLWLFFFLMLIALQQQESVVEDRPEANDQPWGSNPTCSHQNGLQSKTAGTFVARARQTLCVLQITQLIKHLVKQLHCTKAELRWEQILYTRRIRQK